MGFFRVSKAKDVDYSKLEELSFPLSRAQFKIAWGRINHSEFPDENGFGEKFREHTLKRAIN
jgi:hypothetical protein